MTLRNIPLELDTFCEGEEARRVLNLPEFAERTTDTSTPTPEPSGESTDDKSS
jgi:hypothetical protein